MYEIGEVVHALVIKDAPNFLAQHVSLISHNNTGLMAGGSAPHSHSRTQAVQTLEPVAPSVTIAGKEASMGSLYLLFFAKHIIPILALCT